MSYEQYLVKGSEIGLVVGFVFYLLSWGLTLGIRLFKIIK